MLPANKRAEPFNKYHLLALILNGKPGQNLTDNQARPNTNVVQRKEIICMERQSEFNRLSVIYSFS